MEKDQSSSPNTRTQSKEQKYIYVTPEKRTKPVNYSPEKKKHRIISDSESIQMQAMITEVKLSLTWFFLSLFIFTQENLSL